MAVKKRMLGKVNVHVIVERNSIATGRLGNTLLGGGIISYRGYSSSHRLDKYCH